MAPSELFLAVQDALKRGYKVTHEGDIVGLRGRKIGSIQDDGYVHMRFIDSSRRGFSPYAHQFVYMALKGDVEPGHDVCHINHDKADNRIINLIALPHRVNSRQTAAAGRGGGGRGVVRKKSAEESEEILRDSRGLLVDLWKVLQESRKGTKATDEEFGVLWDRLAKILEIH